MKKKMTITIEVDTNHQSKEDWIYEKHFIENEFDDVLDIIADTSGRKYKNFSGQSASGASTYKVSIKNI